MNPFQPLKNACNMLLSQRPGTTPDVSGGINNYFRPLIFSRIRKETINSQLVEMQQQIETVGFLTPGGRKLEMKSEGQRLWNRWTLFTIPSVDLAIDDRVTILNLTGRNTYYRVMANQDFSDSGYIAYDLIEDYDYELPNIPDAG